MGASGGFLQCNLGVEAAKARVAGAEVLGDTFPAMTASISIGDIGVFALCVALGLGWIAIVHHFLKEDGAGESSEGSEGPSVGSHH